MRHIKNFRMFEAVNEKGDFIVEADTKQDEFEAALEEKLDARYDYGSYDTFSDVVSTMVVNSLMALGKTEDEACEIAGEMDGFFDYNQTRVDNPYADYGNDVEGNNTYKGRAVCEFEAGGDGYGYSAKLKDVTELFEDILELLGFSEVNESSDVKKDIFDIKKELHNLNREHEKLVKKVKSLPSPGAHVSKAKSDMLAIEKKIKELEKKRNSMLVPKKK
jgi:hypothetical protein